MGSAPARDGSGRDTRGARYTQRLTALDSARWRRLLRVQAPYRWNVRRLGLGFTLDVGAGLGRNLAHLGGNGVGVDHNPDSVAIARARGLTAYTVEEFATAPEARPGSFDSLLLAHVVEHLSRDEGLALIRRYLPYLKPGGRVCLITPQESGFRSDPTHVRFVDFAALDEICRVLGLTPVRRYSFPLPRRAGRLFRYNEFVLLATAPDPARAA